MHAQPKAINATRMGVGACLWEGELLLAAYLASLPLYRFIGSRVVELGAGPGLVGLMLAKLGAKVSERGVHGARGCGAERGGWGLTRCSNKAEVANRVGLLLHRPAAQACALLTLLGGRRERPCVCTQ